MNCVILQPSYIPWRGYFHQIARADLFIFYDDVKYDKNGWRNRNRIKTPQGLKWLTIPVNTQGVERNKTPINRIEIGWAKKWTNAHFETLKMAYQKAPFFDRYAPLLQNFYDQHPARLSDFTIDTTIALADALGIANTQFMRSSELAGVQGAKSERLINILTMVGASHYISGPAARSYLDGELFKQAGITLEFMTYNYPEYEQLYPPYEPGVSILDLLFMTGPKALNHILSKNQETI
jgi:hypothetical protein